MQLKPSNAPKFTRVIKPKASAESSQLDQPSLVALHGDASIVLSSSLCKTMNIILHTDMYILLKYFNSIFIQTHLADEQQKLKAHLKKFVVCCYQNYLFPQR